MCIRDRHPGVAGDDFGFRQVEVFHDAERFSVRSEVGVEEAVGAGVLVGVGEGELVADGVFLEEAEGVADADVEVCTGDEAGPVEVGAGHEEEIGGCSGVSRRLGGSGGLVLSG